MVKKIHPFSSPPSSSPSSSSSSSSSSSFHVSPQRESFTVWMKSLIFNGNGCTVFDSGGRIAYRLDNYGSKSCSKVFLMDLNGKLLLNILKKKLRVFGSWEGYRCRCREEGRRPWFQVERSCWLLNARRRGHPVCKVWTESGYLRSYQLLASSSDSSYKVVDLSQRTVLAEVRRKRTESGIALGEDVFALEIESSVDHLLIMGLVIVYGLMNNTI